MAWRNRIDTGHACLDPLAMPPDASLLGRLRISVPDQRCDPIMIISSALGPWLHRRTICSATMPPYHWLRLIFCGSTPNYHIHPLPNPRDIRRPQHRLCHLSIQAGGASQDNRVRAKIMCSLKQARPMPLPPPPTTSPLPGLNVKICCWGSQAATLSGSRVQRLATNERSIHPSKPCGLMHGRVLAMSCRDSVQSLTHTAAPDPSRSSR